MTVQELKDSLTARGLPTTGNKPALIKRLKEDSAFALELMQASEGSVDGYKTVGEALEAAAKRGERMNKQQQRQQQKAAERPFS